MNGETLKSWNFSDSKHRVTIDLNANKMRRLVAAINMTLDGFCDHTAMIADAEIDQHYSELLRSADAILYGRITYQLMESYWPTVVKIPTGNKATDDSVLAMHDISKIVFFHGLKNVEWEMQRWPREALKRKY